MSKRLFDFCASVISIIVFLPVMVLTGLLILMIDGRPICYVSERMGQDLLPFKILKFRTMKPAPHQENMGVSGGDKLFRISPLGRLLRRYKVDELPQLFNILWGQMSFVGPRPPLRQYTDALPEIYAHVLLSKPGLTGLATLIMFKHEERLLSVSRSAAESNQIYMRRCIPRKARLDLIYNARKSFWLDMIILWRTFCCVIGLARRPRTPNLNIPLVEPSSFRLVKEKS